MSNYNYLKTSLDLELYDQFISYNVLVVYNYTPEEIGNRSGHPDSWTESFDADTEIISVKLEVGDNIFATLDTEYLTGELESKLLEDIYLHVELELCEQFGGSYG